MPGSGRSEIFFIIGMMVLTLILSGIAMYFFVRTYRKEMRQREERRSQKPEARSQKSEDRSWRAVGGGEDVTRKRT